MTEFKNLTVGEVLSESQYYTVVKKVGDKVQLKNDYGEDIVVNGEYVQKCLTSATQFIEEKKITKTEAAALFIANPYVAMTASFNKQVKEVDVVKEIMNAYGDATPKAMEAAVKKAVKNALQGEERIITGRHTGTQDEFGRINFVDMNIAKVEGKEYDLRLRLVDPRTLNYLILRGVKYIVK